MLWTKDVGNYHSLTIATIMFLSLGIRILQSLAASRIRSRLADGGGKPLRWQLHQVNERYFYIELLWQDGERKPEKSPEAPGSAALMYPSEAHPHKNRACFQQMDGENQYPRSCLHIHANACTLSTSQNIFLHTWAHTHRHTDTDTHTETHTYTNTHTHIHKHTHTHIQIKATLDLNCITFQCISHLMCLVIQASVQSR